MASRQQVQMDVEYRLPGLAVAVQHSAVAALVVALLPGNRRCPADELSHERLVFRCDIVRGRDVFLRDDQDVERRLGVDVVEREQIRVFEYLR